jgi:hypothetical protein
MVCDARAAMYVDVISKGLSVKDHHATAGVSVGWRKRLVLAALPVAALATIPLAASVPAYAAGKSGTVAGCYAQWWNTAFAGYCVNTTQTVTVRLQADCNNEGDYVGGYHTIGKGSTVSPFDSSECSFSVNSAFLAFK